jgi:hypothetical protein
MVDPEGRVSRGCEKVTARIATVASCQLMWGMACHEDIPDGVVNASVGANLDGVRDTFGEKAVLLNVWLQEKVCDVLV